MASLEPSATVDTLTKRTGFVELLLDGPKQKFELVDESGTSRSTVDRALRDLERHDLIERTSDGFALTLYGRLALREYRAFTRSLDDLGAANALISALPADSAVSVDLLDGADTVVSQPQAPMKAVVRFADLVRDAKRIRGFSPVILPQYVDLFHERIVDDGMSAELVLEPGVVEHLMSDYHDQFQETLSTGRLSVRESPGSLPFGLVITGSGEVGVVVYEDGTVRGVVTNDTDDALVWAEQVYLAHREDTTPLSPPGA